MDNNKTIDINEAILELRDLVRRTPLTEAERARQRSNLEAMKQVAGQWMQMRQQQKENLNEE